LKINHKKGQVGNMASETNMEKSLEERRALTFSVDSKIFQNNPPFPRELTIDINNRCNHRCYFCANPKIDQFASLEIDIIYDLMRQGVENGCTDLALQATGDPFMDKRLVKIVDKAKKLGYQYVYLNTNGALATPNIANSVADAGLDSIKFSISATNREEYEAVHGKDDFDKVIKNLESLYKYRNDNNVDLGIYVSCVVNAKANIVTDDFKKLISQYCDHFDYRELSNQGGSMIELNDTEYINSDNILGSLKSEEQTGHCVYPFNRIVVNPYGYVVTCTADFYNKLAIADVRKYTLLEIWNGDVFKFLREKHLNNELSGIYCDRCLNNADTSASSLIDLYNNK
jgi:MoaA/NifB/PqqE/SkfB family radical SAM enzyme